MSRRTYQKYGRFITKDGRRIYIHSNKNRCQKPHKLISRNLLLSTNYILPIAASVTCAIIPYTCLINLMISHHEYVKTIVTETYKYIKTKQENRSNEIKTDAIQNIGNIIDKNNINDISNKIGEKFSYYINKNEYKGKVPEDLSLLIGTETSKQIISSISSKAFNWASKAI